MNAYPLHWPAGRPRTRSRTRSKFKVQSFARVRDELMNQLALMQARGVVLSTNLRLRQDGLPLAGQAQPADPAVAVHFDYKGKAVAFACDRWDRIEDNMQAVRHTIEALRGIARWGTGDMVDAAFTGFAALPPAGPTWLEVLELSHQANADDVREAVRRELLARHPDRGGSAEAWEELQRAIGQMPQELRP